MSDEGHIIELGFYGKLPTYGDFIQKRLPTDFINPWHEWLQAGMMTCRERDPDGWLTFYLNCPAWSFVLAGGICGQQAVAGVTIPSVDRVGRYFNFTMASLLPCDTVPAVFASARSGWLKSLENLAMSVLEEEMDQDEIEHVINELSAELSSVPDAGFSFDTDEEHARVVSDEPADVSDLLPQMLHKLITASHEGYGLWWHQGSSQVSAQLVSCANMPTGNTYLGLMMNEDMTVPPAGMAETSEVDYVDELLSD